jgi:hypothetical protein
LHGVDALKRAAHTCPFLAKPMLPRSRKAQPRETACSDVLEDLPKTEVRPDGSLAIAPGDRATQTGIETRFTTAADLLLTLPVAHAQDQLKEGCSERSTPTSIAWGSTWAGISLDVVTAGKVCVSFEVPLTTGNRQHQ